MLKFSMLTVGAPDASAGWAGLGGGRVASAAGGTGVDSPEAGETAAARVGAQPASGTMPTSKSAPNAVRQPGPRRTQIACVDIELTKPPARCVGGRPPRSRGLAATSHLHRQVVTGLHRWSDSEQRCRHIHHVPRGVLVPGSAGVCEGRLRYVVAEVRCYWCSTVAGTLEGGWPLMPGRLMFRRSGEHDVLAPAR